MTKKAAKWWLVILGVVLPVLYVLSPGPIMKILESGSRNGVVDEFFQIVYFPLEWLYNHVGWIQVFYDWWFGVWGTR